MYGEQLQIKNPKSTVFGSAWGPDQPERDKIFRIFSRQWNS